VADNRHVPSPDPPETLLLTLQGEVCHCSPGAHRLLLMAEGGASRKSLSKPLDLLAGQLLPMLLSQLRQQARTASPERAPPPSITHETVAGQFVATGHVLRPLHPGPVPLAQVTLQRLEPHRVALERALRDLPLTPGQAAVCRELVEGHTHAQISQYLGVAPATVVDHVRKAYQALDVRSALELRAVIEGRIAKT
jgi:DNA-binding CsgD family transcriptional regulator